MAKEKREKAMTQQTGLHIGNHVLDLLKLPEAARQELLTFYEFLIFKYQAQADRTTKQHILSDIFKEAEGVLPDQYTFNREELHER
ncbi:MAG: hypothetical protein Q3M30_17540 [Candidatus Electrothrix sp. Rat3]|nr:hypothetical protein [Candidatus Electrothrix rattekaaiensis]